MTAHLRHLVRRFFRGLSARRLRPAEQAEAARLLRREEVVLFWRQSPADQRHALACARAVLGRGASNPEVARAALLHDVGKGAAGIGVAGRVLATVLSLARLPAPARLGAYLAHGPIGADELAAVGCEPLVVAYARHHHGARPPSIGSDDWDLLRAADRT
jgi:hypothetical protein